jgi:hypothetical protein
MLNIIVPETFAVNAIMPEPKAIERVLVLVEAKMPVLKVKPARARVP